METVSVIVAIYNVEAYLDTCVRSILEQTYRDLEVILVDDGSPDGCGAKCDAYAAQDARVIVLHKENGGLSSARNAGIEHMTGNLLLFVDGDDFLEPTMVERLYTALQVNCAQMSLCAFRYVDETDQPLPNRYNAPRYRLNAVCTPAQFWVQYCTAYTPAYTVAWNKLYRRELFAKVRYPLGRLHEDEFVLHTIVEQCTCIGFVSEQLYNYRQRSGSIMGSRLNVRQLDKVDACLIRAVYFRGKQNAAMVQAAVFEAIDMLEWYRYECRRAAQPLPESWQALRHRTVDFICQPTCVRTPIYWSVVLAFRADLLPYAPLRWVLDKLRAIGTRRK